MYSILIYTGFILYIFTSLWLLYANRSVYFLASLRRNEKKNEAKNAQTKEAKLHTTKQRFFAATAIFKNLI